MKQAEEGLKLAEETKAPAEVIDRFHTFLAEWKLLTGVRAELIEPHLAWLRASASQHSKVLAAFLDAIVADRAGKLEKARKLLEPLTNQKDKDVARRANYAIARLSLSLNDPNRALKALKELEPAFQQYEKLSPEEKVWADEIARTLDELLALQVRANLGIALQEVNRFRKENPGKQIPGDLVSQYETAVEAILKKLDFKTKGKSKGDLMARLALVSYLVATARRDVAEVRLSELATDYPSSLDVLRAQALLLAAPRDPKAKQPDANGIAAADLLIQKHIRANPASIASKLFYATWMMQTKRADKAIEYLKNPENFPGHSDLVDRVLASALLRSGQREEAQKILNRLPASPGVDLTLIETALDKETAEKRLQRALAGYEKQGRFRLAKRGSGFRRGSTRRRSAG